MSKGNYSFEMDIKFKVNDLIDYPEHPYCGCIEMSLSSKHKGTGEIIKLGHMISKTERENPPIFCKDVGELICHQFKMMAGKFLEAFRRDRQ